MTRPPQRSRLYRKPKFGRLHTHHASPRLKRGTKGSEWVQTAREGTGDFRGKYGEYGELIYRPLRNGLPERRDYVYRAPGWEERLRKSGLDPEAIRRADASQPRKPWVRTAPRRAGDAGPPTKRQQPQPTMREIPAQVARRLARGRGGGGSAR